MQFWQTVSRVTLIGIILLLLNLSFHAVNAQTAEPTSEPTTEPANAPPSPPLTLVWQSEYSLDVPIVAPVDIALDAQGNVYVTTGANKPIKKFDRNGKLVAQWGASGGDGEGQFSLAAGIAVDAQGNIYIGDFSTNRVEKLDKDGKFVLQWSTEQPNGPGGIGVDKQGNVYVSNFAKHDHYVQKYDSNGKLLKLWGSTGKGDGEFGGAQLAGPEDLAMDKDDNIYIADKLNQRIQKFDTEGKFLAKFDGNGVKFYPTGVAVDSKGNIYVVDNLNHFFSKFDPKGNLIAQWTIRGGDLDGAGLLVLDAEDNIYVYATAKVPSVRGGTTSALLIKKFKQS